MRRREFLGGCLAVAGACLASSSRMGRAASRPAPPNILMILADDLGSGDLGAFGAGDLRTPHVDRLVREGMRFDRFYANCPVCSPTRAALLSGRYPELVGVPGVIRTSPSNSWGYLTDDAVLLPQLLRARGYATALVGKWHLGLSGRDHPNQRGFDFFHGFLGDMMDDYYTHRRDGRNYMRLNHETIETEGHATDLFSRWACDYLKQRSGQEPFFLLLAYNAPHDPIQPAPQWLQRIRQRQPAMDARRAQLGAMIEHMDDGIGRVLAALEEAGQAEHTLVVFTSDNGGVRSLGASNGPLRGGKGSMFEGGLRVPMAVRWPGRIAPGSVSERVLLTMDLMPTFAEAASVRIEHEIDGRSFLPALLGRDQPWPPRDLFFGRREGGAQRGGTIEAIRRGDWKLLRQTPGGPPELYNLAEDPAETTNVAAAHPQLTADLTAALEAQLARYAKVPWRPADAPVP